MEEGEQKKNEKIIDFSQTVTTIMSIMTGKIFRKIGKNFKN